MFSIVGIVIVIGIALAASMMSRKQPLPAVQPAVPVVQEPVQQPSPQININSNAPMPAPVVENPQQQVYNPPPIQPEQVYTPPPEHVPQTPMRTTGNRKLDGMRDMTGIG